MSGEAERRVLLVFVDGLGLGRPDPALNPLYRGDCPRLTACLEHDCVPVDAGLGVPGLPQSATGQTALLTGINAPAAIGRHVEGFPHAALKDLIRGNNLFARVRAAGLTATFANAYWLPDQASVRDLRLQSVTTVAALDGLGGVRLGDALTRGDAVYQDLTRALLRPRGYTGPLVTPAQSACDLAALAARHHFTLFEYFQSDRAGHSGDPAQVARVLGELEAFWDELERATARHGVALALASDHGNIEDAGVRTHTTNPVPFGFRGADADSLRARARRLTDIAPLLLEWLGKTAATG